MSLTAIDSLLERHQGAMTKAEYKAAGDEIRELIRAARRAAFEEAAMVVARICADYREPDRFKPHESWKENMTVADVYGTGASDVLFWAEQEILRALAATDASPGATTEDWK